MHVSWRDSIATVLVAIGVMVYGAWLVGPGLPGFVEPVGVALAVLALGVAASISAVVPGWRRRIGPGGARPVDRRPVGDEHDAARRIRAFEPAPAAQLGLAQTSGGRPAKSRAPGVPAGRTTRAGLRLRQNGDAVAASAPVAP